PDVRRRGTPCRGGAQLADLCSSLVAGAWLGKQPRAHQRWSRNPSRGPPEATSPALRQGASWLQGGSAHRAHAHTGGMPPFRCLALAHRDAGAVVAAMAARFTESLVEEATLEWLSELGWTVVHGDEVAPGTLRADYASVVLSDVLQGALRRLNPGLPDDALA